MHLLEWKILTLEGCHPEFQLLHTGFVTLGKLVGLFGHFVLFWFVMSRKYEKPLCKVIVQAEGDSMLAISDDSDFQYTFPQSPPHPPHYAPVG